MLLVCHVFFLNIVMHVIMPIFFCVDNTPNFMNYSHLLQKRRFFSIKLVLYHLHHTTTNNNLLTHIHYNYHDGNIYLMFLCQVGFSFLKVRTPLPAVIPMHIHNSFRTDMGHYIEQITFVSYFQWTRMNAPNIYQIFHKADRTFSIFFVHFIHNSNATLFKIPGIENHYK